MNGRRVLVTGASSGIGAAAADAVRLALETPPPGLLSDVEVRSG